MPFQTLEGAPAEETGAAEQEYDEHTQTIKERAREKGENMWNSERGEKIEQKESTVKTQDEVKDSKCLQ